MASRMNFYKIVAVILVFLIFLQNLYLYAVVELNFNYVKPPSLAADLSLENSLFYIKTGTLTSKRSPHEPLSFSSTSDNLQDEVRESANTTLKINTLRKSTTVSSQNKNDTSSSTATNVEVNIKINSSNSSKTYTIRPVKLKAVTQAPVNKSIVERNDVDLPFCPTRPPTLLGNVRVTLKEPPTLAEIERIHSDLALGGRFKPPGCRSKDRVAIILPFRDREEHLRTFLFNILPFLKRQQIEFNIFVIEQGNASAEEPFNRAMLFNIGFMEANKRGEFDCFIFHDVDLIPENDYNLYNCPQQPRHMSVAVDKMNYKLPYYNIFGGVGALTKAHFTKVNGFSNSYWGWGAEDDDMAGRIAFNGLYMSRPPENIARYKMLKHKEQDQNYERFEVLDEGRQRFKSDGLSNLKYDVEQVVLGKTKTLLRVKLAKLHTENLPQVDRFLIEDLSKDEYVI